MIRKVAVLLILSQSLLAQGGWQRQTSGTIRNLRAISYLTQSKALAVGDSSTILRTTDNGIHWMTVPVSRVYNFCATSFISSDSGFLASNLPLRALHRTTNGGMTWDTVVTGVGGTGVSFVDGTTGHVCEGYSMYRTTDGGRSWSRYDFPLTYVPGFKAVKMFDGSTGIAVGSLYTYVPPLDYPSSVVFRTTNGGVVWGSAYASGYPGDPFTKPFYAVAFDGPDRGIAVGDSGKIVTSTDRGQHWTVRTIGIRRRLYGVAYQSHGVTAVGDSGTIIRSTDDGATWQVQTSGVTEPLYGVSFTDSSTGTAVGARGTILHTTTGGVNGIRARDQSLPEGCRLLQNYPNPFNPSTTIEYSIASRSRVMLTVLDLLGRVVGTLVDGVEEAGYKSVVFNGGRLASGVYFCRLRAGSFVATEKLLVLR